MEWSRDLIHLSSEGYQRLASCIVDELQHPQVKLERLTTGHRSPDRTKKRKGWTHKSDMTASRGWRDNLPWCARPRGDAADYRGGAGPGPEMGALCRAQEEPLGHIGGKMYSSVYST